MDLRSLLALLVIFATAGSSWTTVGLREIAKPVSEAATESGEWSEQSGSEKTSPQRDLAGLIGTEAHAQSSLACAAEPAFGFRPMCSALSAPLCRGPPAAT
jgi:hypothetical protein